MRAVAVDLVIGLGIPILVMILRKIWNIIFRYSLLTLHPKDYIVQGHRFDIYEEIGCMPVTYNTWLAYLVLYLPNLVICVISGTYAGQSPINTLRVSGFLTSVL